MCSYDELLKTTIGEYKSLLNHHFSLFSDIIKQAKQEDEVPVLMLTYAYEFGINVLDCVERMFEEEREGVLICAICRPYYEIAFRLLWSSREPYGWERLQSYFANQDLKFAQCAKMWSLTETFAREKITENEEILNRRDPTGTPFKQAPSIEQTLKDIRDRDISEGLISENTDTSGFEYTFFYRILCRYSHAHIGSISPKGRDIPSPFVIFALNNATFALLRSIIQISTKNPKNEITEVFSCMSKILKNYLEAIGFVLPQNP